MEPEIGPFEEDSRLIKANPKPLNLFAGSILAWGRVGSTIRADIITNTMAKTVILEPFRKAGPVTPITTSLVGDYHYSVGNWSHRGASQPKPQTPDPKPCLRSPPRHLTLFISTKEQEVVAAFRYKDHMSMV